MATGIRKRHSAGCPAKQSQEERCRCNAGYEAAVWARRSGRLVKVRKTFKQQAEARSWRVDMLKLAKSGALRPTKRDVRTMADALEEFIADAKAGRARPRKRPAYKPATIRTYEQHVNNHLRDSMLGWTKVSEVQRADVQEYADRLLGEGLRPGTVNNALDPIRAFFRREVDRERLAINPAERIDIPEDTDPRPKRIASAEDAAKLLAALSRKDRPLWATAFYAGLRRGELQGLRVADIDLGASRIHVERGWDQEEGAIDPKSQSSRRSVPLLAILRDYLDQHLLGVEGGNDALVFGRTDSTPFAPMAIGKRATKAWEAAKLQAITLHECRHTFASLLIDSGANAKAIQTFMGHSKIQTTFDTYGHLMPGSHDEVRERMDAYLTGSRQAAQVSPDPGSL